MVWNISRHEYFAFEEKNAKFAKNTCTRKIHALHLQYIYNFNDLFTIYQGETARWAKWARSVAGAPSLAAVWPAWPGPRAPPTCTAWATRARWTSSLCTPRLAGPTTGTTCKCWVSAQCCAVCVVLFIEILCYCIGCHCYACYHLYAGLDWLAGCLELFLAISKNRILHHTFL